MSGGILGVSAQGDLGQATDSTSFRGLGGIYDLRADPVNVSFNLKTYDAVGSATVIAARSVGGAGINQTITLGGAIVNNTVIGGFNDSVTAVTTSFGYAGNGSGNDGYGITLNSGAVTAATTGIFAIVAGTATGITSNLNGLLTINGSLSNSNTATSLNTITAAGDVLLNGNLLNTAAGIDTIWIKAGAGSLAITGTGATTNESTGAFNITNGTVIVNAMGAFNGTAGGGVQLGAVTNGIINYVGSSTGGLGETSAKAIINSLSTASQNAVIFANQQQNPANTSASALILTSSIAASGAVSKSLYLSGYNNTNTATVVNQIEGVIQDNSTSAITSLVKAGSGTWQYAPAPSSYATAVPTSYSVASGGAANTNFFVTGAGTNTPVVGESVTGTNIPAGSIITSISGSSTAWTIYINNNLIAAASGALTFGTVGLTGAAGENFTGNVSVEGGTLQIAPTASSNNGSAPLSSSNNIIFTADGLSGNGYAGGTFQLLGTPATITGALTTSVGQLQISAGAGTIVTTATTNGGTPTLDFVNATPLTRSAGAVVDFDPGAGTTIEFSTSPTATNGIIGGYAYFTNAATSAVDFAAVTNVSGVFVVGAYTGYTTGLPVSGFHQHRQLSQ